MGELKRLLDEPDSDLDRLLLESALDDAPPDHAAERTLAALGLGGAAVGLATSTGIGTGGVASGLASKGGLFGGALLKWTSIVAVAGAVLGGGYALTRTPPTLDPPTNGSANNALALNPTEHARDRSWAELAPHTDTREAHRRGPGTLPRRSDAGGLSSEKGARQDGTTTRRPSVVERSAVAAGATSVALRDGATSKKPAVNVEALDDEIALLDQARRALIEGHYDACLARLAAYQTRFPHGQLAAEASNMGRVAQQKKSGAAATP